MAKIAPVKETIAEKIKLLHMTNEKAERKGIKPLFVIVPVVVAMVAATTLLTVRRLRSKSWF